MLIASAAIRSSPASRARRDGLLEGRRGALVVARGQHDRSEVAERVGEEARLAGSASRLERFLGEVRCRVVVALQKRERGRGRERAAALVRWSVLGFLERSLQAAAPLDDVTAHVPEATQRHGDCELQLTFPGLMEMVERRAKAVVLGLENVEPLALAIAAQMRRRLLHQRLAPLRMAAPRQLELGRVRLELAGRELVDRLEKQEPLPAPAFGSLDEMVIDERGDRVEGRVAHSLGGVERAPPGKTDSRASVRRSSSSSRSTLQAIVSRRVCCRAGRSRGPPVSRPSRVSSRWSSA